jgi:hypothetical protein
MKSFARTCSIFPFLAVCICMYTYQLLIVPADFLVIHQTLPEFVKSSDKVFLLPLFLTLNLMLIQFCIQGITVSFSFIFESMNKDTVYQSIALVVMHSILVAFLLIMVNYFKFKEIFGILM